jgi:Leucine-rich repeat (LRR) protein
MRKLTVLRADSNWIGYLPPLDWLTVLRELDLSYNWLQSLPQSIGKLSALKELDLSYNWLPTLPLPITGLKPTVLNLNVNFMCAPGNTIEQWANQYAPGWKDRQYCNFSSPNGPY